MGRAKKPIFIYLRVEDLVYAVPKALALEVKGVYYSLEQPEMSHLDCFTNNGIPHHNYLNRPYATEMVLRGEHDSSIV